MTDNLVERVARALCEADMNPAGNTPDYMDLARAAIAVEPTRKMAIAATRIGAKILGGSIPDDAAEKIGRLLLKAAFDAALQEDKP